MAINFSELGFQKIRKIIDTEDKEFPIEIYNPTKEQRAMILELAKSNLEIDEESNKVTAKITDSDFINKLLGELSNIYLDLDDKETINNILNNPSEILRKVKKEIGRITDDVFLDYYEELKDLGKLPEEIQEELFKLVEDNKGNDISDKEKEKQELLKRLAEIDNE